jgi:hypothetical protein
MLAARRGKARNFLPAEGPNPHFFLAFEKTGFYSETKILFAKIFRREERKERDRIDGTGTAHAPRIV